MIEMCGGALEVSIRAICDKVGQQRCFLVVHAQLGRKMVCGGALLRNRCLRRVARRRGVVFISGK